MIRSAAIIVFNGERYITIESKRHFICLKIAREMGIERINIARATHGFVNDSGAFLDRWTAAKEAYLCGQIPKETGELFSEYIFTDL